MVGIVGAAVPSELVLAAGLRPVRLSERARSTPLLDALGFEDFDAATRAAGEQVLSGGPGLDFVVIGSDTTAHTTLFKTLRELRRIGAGEAIPPLAFLDLLYLPHRTSARYNRDQLERLAARLGEWSGIAVSGARLRAAIARVNGTRRLFAELTGLRRAVPAAVSGREVLGAVAAALTAEPEAAQAGLRPLLARAAAGGRPQGRRVYLTGSPHEDASVYEQIEADGRVIVGEDHPRGELAFAGQVDENGDPLEALVEHYQQALLAGRCASARRAAFVADAARAAAADVVACWMDEHDAATPWDVPTLRRAVAETALPYVDLRTDGIEAL